MRLRLARSTVRRWSTCWPAIRWRVASRSPQGTRASGPAVMPRPAPNAPSPTTPRAMRRVSPSWIAPLGFARESWTAPRHVRRRRPQEHSHAVAAEQIRGLLPHLPAAHADGALPWFVVAAGYDPVHVQLTQALGATPVAIVVRRRSGRCFSADPRAPPQLGRRRRHGHKFTGDEPPTWPPPDGDLTIDDPVSGNVRGRAWTQLHPQTHGQQAQRDARGGRPLGHGTLLLVEVSRWPDSPQQTRDPQALGLWWPAPPGVPETQLPDLDRVWRADVRRCALEQSLRSLKQTLHWTRPRVRHPEQADRWTWLVVRAYPQLRLARPLAQDQPLPWQQAQPSGKRTPARVQRAFSLLLPRLPIRARAPTPCGRSPARSPARPTGKRSGRATRYPALTKALLSASQAAYIRRPSRPPPASDRSLGLSLASSRVKSQA